ncbi:MAG: hypothetical protein WEC99_10525 [Halofilum sp. (in: g-proteobacteria)]
MSYSHQTPDSNESATILQFPIHRTRPGRDDGERVVTESYWMIVARNSDGSTRLTRMRSPHFLSPGRAYAWSAGLAGDVRSLLLYRFARSPAAPAERVA